MHAADGGESNSSVRRTSAPTGRRPAHIVNADHALGMVLGDHSFRKYVRIDANVADLPSRGKWEDGGADRGACRSARHHT